MKVQYVRRLRQAFLSNTSASFVNAGCASGWHSSCGHLQPIFMWRLSFVRTTTGVAFSTPPEQDSANSRRAKRGALNGRSKRLHDVLKQAGLPFLSTVASEGRMCSEVSGLLGRALALQPGRFWPWLPSLE